MRILHRFATIPAFFAIALAASRTEAQGQVHPGSVDVATTVDSFHQALARGDSANVIQLLTPDAVIVESGEVQNRAEYRSHHLPADIGFAQAVPSERGPIHVRVNGSTAWAHSTSVTSGQFRGRSIDSQGAELMVLVRTGDGWKIAAIHWSSRNRSKQ